MANLLPEQAANIDSGYQRLANMDFQEKELSGKSGQSKDALLRTSCSCFRRCVST